MIVKSCPNGCDPEDRLGIWNFRDEGFKFCPMCGTLLTEEERLDPVYQPGKVVSFPEAVKTLWETYLPELRKQLESQPSPFEKLLRNR